MGISVRVRLLGDWSTSPAQRSGDSGADLYAAHDVDVEPWKVARVRFGVAFEIPPGFGGYVMPRSGQSSEGRVVVPGTIDHSYRGEVCATLHNTTGWPWSVKRGDRVAQLVVMPVPRVEYVVADELSETERGANGFGSTGLR